MRLNTIKNKLSNSPLFKDSFWALLGSVLGKGLSLLGGIVVARFLGNEIYGEYGLIKTTLLNIAVFSTLGLGYTGTRYIAKLYENNKDEIKTIVRIIYKITFFVSLIIASLLFVFSSQVSTFIKAPDLSLALKFTAIIIVLNALTTSQIGILSGLKQFKRIAINNTYSGILTFITSALFAYLWGLNGALLSLFVSMAFNTFINHVAIIKACKYLGDKGATMYSTWEIASFSIPIALQESLYSIVTWMISYLIITFAGYGELGINSAALQWSSVVMFIPGVLKNVILSYFSSENDTMSLRKKMIAVNFFATFIPCIVIAILSKWICQFYGTTFANLDVVLIISCSSSIFASISAVVIYEFISLGKNWFVFFIRLLRDISVLCLCWLVLSQNQVVPASILVNVVTISVYAFFMFILLLSISIYSKKIKKHETVK